MSRSGNLSSIADLQSYCFYYLLQNLPFGLDSPMRFTVCYLIAGIVGFGAPFLVIRHQMLRNVTDEP